MHVTPAECLNALDPYQAELPERPCHRQAREHPAPRYLRGM